jgi:hypothetical protein
MPDRRVSICTPT